MRLLIPAIVLGAASLLPVAMAQQAAPAGDVARGRGLVAAHCTECHNGRTAPTFSQVANMPWWTQESLERNLSDGFPVRHGQLTMPAIRLDPAEVKDVSAYVRSLKGQ